MNILLDTTLSPFTLSLMVIGGILIIILVTALVSLLEGVVLTILAWDEFGSCVRASFRINSVPTVLALVFMAVAPLGWTGIGIALLFSILVDGALLARLKPGSLLKNYINSILINMVSYAIIIAPAYLMQ